MVGASRKRFFLLIIIFFLAPVLFMGEGTEPAAGRGVPPAAVEGEVSLEPVPAGLSSGEPALFFRNGCAYVVGEIKNKSTGAVARVKVEAVFRNWSGEIIGREYTYINHLNQEEEKPYRLLIPEEEAVAGVEVRVVAASPAEERLLPAVAEDLEVTRGKAGFFHVSGKITNHGRGKLDFVKVILKFTGAEGDILEVTPLFLRDLKPGQGREFSCSSEEREGWTGVEVLFD